MRIFDDDHGQGVKDIIILLTRDEAVEVASVLADMIDGRVNGHVHVNDREYQHEVTFALYDDETKKGNTFNDRIMRLIVEDE